ncbi:MAG: hypothetical protein AAF489_09670 [Bacteroidota bacterium]
MKKILLAITLIGSGVFAQNMSEQDLANETYDSLISYYDQNVHDTLVARRIANVYIDKARLEQDSIRMARGYSRLSFVSKYEEALKYLDTTIQLSKNSNHKNFPTVGYLFKSLYHYNNEAYEESLKNAISGYQYAKQKGNVGQQITALHQINGINELWGDYNKTLEAEQLTYSLLQENKGINRYYELYQSSVEGLGKCYVRLKKPDSALYFFQKGIERALRAKDTATYHAFVSRTGTALYIKGNYAAALDSLNKAINTEISLFPATLYIIITMLGVSITIWEMRRRPLLISKLWIQFMNNMSSCPPNSPWFIIDWQNIIKSRTTMKCSSNTSISWY